MARKPSLPQGHGQVVIAYIHSGSLSSYFTESLIATLLLDGQRKRKIVGLLQEWSSANISAARNLLTQRFLDDYQAEWLLWVDSDMQFGADALDALLASADPDSAPIVGGLCFGMMQGRLFPTIYMLAEDDEGKARTVRVGQYPADALVKVAGTGAAFLLIHRTALDTIRGRGFNPTFPFFQETEMHGQPVGEDVTFCLRALACNLPIHVNTAVKVGHHKSNLLTEDMFLGQVEPDPPPAEGPPVP